MTAVPSQAKRALSLFKLLGKLQELKKVLDKEPPDDGTETEAPARRAG